MAYVKLDTGILDSTLWVERDIAMTFITALLMAEPREFKEAIPQIASNATDPTGWVVPAGWYGFVKAAGPGIVRRAGVEEQAGMKILERLGEPDPESRTPEFEGRRLIRVSGGFIVLNYMKYRDKDHTAAERQRRLRERKEAERKAARDAEEVTVLDRDVTLLQQHEEDKSRVTSRIADASADALPISSDTRIHPGPVDNPQPRFNTSTPTPRPASQSISKALRQIDEQRKHAENTAPMPEALRKFIPRKPNGNGQDTEPPAELKDPADLEEHQTDIDTQGAALGMNRLKFESDDAYSARITARLALSTNSQ